VQEVVTRWNATYLMIERLLVLKNNVNMILQETYQNKHRKLLINDNDTEWLSDLIDCLQFFYKMTVKISGQNYVTCSFIIPCLKSLQVAMEALCENDDDDNSEFKI